VVGTCIDEHLQRICEIWCKFVLLYDNLHLIRVACRVIDFHPVNVRSSVHVIAPIAEALYVGFGNANGGDWKHRHEHGSRKSKMASHVAPFWGARKSFLNLTLDAVYSR
jgi:hypothetical protein